MNTAVTRLHITPLTPDLLSTILGPDLSRLAANISYHSLQSFPDRNYGYIDLPVMDAERVKKKLNGSILKGQKIKVEEARSSKRRHATEDDNSQEVEKATKRSRTSKKDANKIEGRVLSPDRKVKRGWTEPKSEKTKKGRDKTNSKVKSQAPSKYTEKDELLFRTRIPKNRTVADDKPAKKTKKADHAVDEVHEFRKSTTIPSFLRAESSAGKKKAAEYRDGEGWVDEVGDLIEAETQRVSRREQAATPRVEHESGTALARRGTPKRTEASNTTNINKSDSEASSVSQESVSSDENEVQKGAAPNRDDYSEETSSSGTSGVESESDTSDITTSVRSGVSSQQTEGTNESTLPQTSLHPLEALFKKPLKPASSQPQSNSQDIAKPSLEISTTFSFFDRQDSDNDLPTMPMTPFSTQDWHSRETRSAAPTPDTAHPSRMSSVFNGRGSDEESSDDSQAEGNGQASQEPTGLQVPQTDFEKRFWEERGENNRSWKARRRAVLKEKRQRENRARRPKNW